MTGRSRRHRLLGATLLAAAALAAAPAAGLEPLALRADPPGQGAGPSLDFDLLPPPPAAETDPALQRALERRRLMLGLHQGVGIGTLTLLGATVVVGQLDFNDRFRGGGDTGRYHAWHRGLAVTAATAFAAGGMLALLAPSPIEKKPRLDSATIHRAAMGLATAGMVAQILLGVMARGEAGSLRERDLAQAHQVVGYGTLGAMAVGVGALFF
jgi:heme A synthase